MLTIPLHTHTHTHTHAETGQLANSQLRFYAAFNMLLLFVVCVWAYVSEGSQFYAAARGSHVIKHENDAATHKTCCQDRQDTLPSEPSNLLARNSSHKLPGAATGAILRHPPPSKET